MLRIRIERSDAEMTIVGSMRISWAKRFDSVLPAVAGVRIWEIPDVGEGYADGQWEMFAER